MNLENLRAKLIAAARSHSPAETAPYAFEKRIMARLHGQRIEDSWSLWATGLWRGAAACAVITALSIMISLWAVPAFADKSDGAPFETVVLAGADELTESW